MYWNVQSVPEKSDTIEIISLFLNRSLSLFGQSENVLKCLTVNTISLNSQVCHHARFRAV